VFAALLFLGAVCWLPESHAQPAGNLPPTVRITAPPDGAVFTAPADIVVEAEASDPDGWVSGMGIVIGPVRLVPVPGDPGTKEGSSHYRFTWPNVPVGEYLLVARAVDNQGAAANSTAVRVSVVERPTEPVLVLGYLRRQVYLNIPGVTVADLTSSPKFPDQPDLADLNTPFETPSNVYDNYGVRLMGFVLPPVTGEYVFYIASDDQGALFLSTDENPANKVQIALEPTWSGPRSWVESPSRPEPSNISAPIRLKSGRKYYVEALMKEGGGGDNLAVTWQKPGDPAPVNGDPPIPGEYLATYWPHPVTNRPPVVTITAPDPVAAEQSPLIDAMPDTARFVVARTGNLLDALTVRLGIGGTAINGTDYDRINPEVLIPAGSATADLWLDAIDDALVEGEETVVIRIAPPLDPTDPTLPPARLPYVIGEPAAARAVIRDNDPQPNQPPQAAIVSPPDGAVIVAPEALRIIARAADADGWVSSVEFFADGVSLGVVPQPPIPILELDSPDLHPEIDPVRPPFQVVWNNPPLGLHVLKAVATDNAGATGESAPVTINILEPTGQPVVTVTATDPMAAEPGSDPSWVPDTATFTIRRTGDLSIPLPVFLTLSGSASNGVDYAELPLTVTIPVNERSVNVVVVPLNDALVEGPERVLLTIEPPVCLAIWPPPPDCYLVGVPARACAVIADNDPPTNLPPVANLIHPSPAEVFPAGSDIRLTATAHDRDGSVVSVEFFEGERSLGIVTAPPEPTPVPPPPGPPVPIGPPFSMTWSNVPAGTYLLKAVATDNLGATGESQPVRIFVVAHEPPPIVTVEATVPETIEPDPLLDCAIADCLPNPAIFTVRRTGPTSEALDVFYDLRGTASNGVDYRELPLWVRIPAGQSSTIVAVEPLDDALVEGTESVILQLVPNPTISNMYPPPPPAYIVGNPGSARVLILDNDPQPTPHVEIVQPHHGQGFLLGTPIEIIAATPVVPPWVERVEFWADGVKIGDGVEQPTPLLGVRRFGFAWTDAPLGQHVLVAYAFNEQGDLPPGGEGVSAPVWIAVYDPHVQVVTIEATDAVASEPGVLTVIDTAEFTVRRTGGASRPLTVFYRIGGTAQNGTDFERLSGSVTLGEDENWATISVNPLRDELVEGDESVALTIVPPILPPGGPTDPVSEGRWFYIIGTPGSAEAVIRDANAPANLPPSVRIAEPRDGWVFQNPPVIRLMASAQDRDGRVIGLEFFAGDVKLGDGRPMIDIAPGAQGFGLTWTNPPLGVHVLTARATDDDGATGVSAPVHITVAPPAGDRELHVVGVYSGMSNGSSSRNHEQGDAAAVVNRPGKYVTLVLSAYEPVLWHLTIAEGTVIERLILGGYYEQTVEGLPPGVPVVTAYPGGPQPWLWMGYAVESGEFYRALCRLHAMTGLEIASFHGSYTAPYPTPFVIDAVQNDPRLRSDYPQPAPLDQLPDLHFSVDFHDGSRVFSQAYTLAGPANGGELLPGNLRVTANADRTKFYGLAGEGILEADAAGGARVIRAPSEVLREGWLMGATFDTHRQWALLVTLSGDGALYGYAPASGLWSTISTMINIDLCSLAYHPALDALFGLEVTRSGRPVIDRFSPDGRKVGEIDLPFMPFDVGVVGHRAELVPVGDYLVMLVAPMRQMWDDLFPDERMYLIDPQSGQAWLTYRNACLCQGSVTIEATDPLASEPGDATVVDAAEFTVRRTGDLTQSLTVRYAIHGSAQNGVDYSTLSGEVTIEAGRTSARIPVHPLPDRLMEGVEDVILELMTPLMGPSNQGLCTRYFVGTPATARATILDSNWMPNQPPRAEIVRPRDGEVFQAPADLPIVVQATDPDGWVPLVEFFADGAKIGEQSIVFITVPPPGEMQTFSMVWASVPPGSHVLTARATDDDGAQTMSPPVSLTVIQPNLPPVVSIFATDPFAREKPMDGQTNTATFKIRRTGSTNEALRVWYSIHGTAENGRDYLEIPGSSDSWGSVEIPAGRRSVRITIQPLNDDLPERVETVVLKLEPAPILAPIELYRIGLPDCAGAIIVDDDSQMRLPVHCLADGAFHVTLPGQNGLAYRLECSANLRDWVSVADGVVTDGQIHYLDPSPSGADNRFYRVRPIVTRAMEVEDD
jgi:hypothetical protein